MASMPVLRPQGTPTIFGDLQEKNITFLVDTSGSMYPFMDVVKEHLLEVLLTRAYRVKDTTFNIMEFSSNVVPWADQMVKCTPQTVTVAAEWIKGLKCKTGTNTLDALLAAFGNPTCDSVYLITDGLPDQPPELILQHVSLIGQNRPVHCVYLTGTNADTPAFDFLQSLAIESAGSFHMISVSLRGVVEHVKAVVNVHHGQSRTRDDPTVVSADSTNKDTDESVSTNQEINNNPSVQEVHAPPLTDSIQGSIPPAPGVSQQPQTTVLEEKEVPFKLCSVKTSLDNYNSPIILPQDVLIRDPVIQTSVLQTQESVLRYPNTAWEMYRPRLLQRQIMKPETKEIAGGSVLVSGMRVLARRDRDGLYCPATVKEQVTTNRCYLLEFDRDPRGGTAQHLLQETGVFDAIPYNTAMRHPIVPGDKVLAPVDEAAYCFAPGTVLEGIEERSSGCAADSENLVISLYNGKSVKVTTQMAVWIPQNLHERIKIETQMPLSAHQYLINNPQYPSNVGNGYVLVQNPDKSQVETVTELRSSSGQPMFVPVYPMAVASGDFHMPSVRESAVKSSEIHRLIPGTSMTKEDLNRKVMSQLIENKMIKSEEVTTFESLQSLPKTCLKKSVSFRETNGELDSGISSTMSTHTDDEYEEKHDGIRVMPLSESQDEDEDYLETLEVETHGINLNDTDDSGIGTDSGPRQALLFSLSNHRKPRRPQSAIPERPQSAVPEKRPPWRHFSNGSTSDAAKSDVKPFRETALKCPPQAKEQPVYLDAELAFDREYPTNFEVRPQSVISTYDDDYLSYPTERPQSEYDNEFKAYPTGCPASQFEVRKSYDSPTFRSFVQYDNSLRYPADNISPNSKVNAKIQQSPMMRAEKIYYDPKAYPASIAHANGPLFDTVDHTPFPTQPGPKNCKGVFRTVNKNGLKVDKPSKLEGIQVQWLLRNNHTRPHPPPTQQHSPTPAHRAFTTRDMVREAKETAYMEYRRMQVVKREDSFKDKEESNHTLQKARLERTRSVTKQHKQTDTVVDVTTVRVCRKYTADVQRRDIQRQLDSEDKLNRTRAAKRAVTFNIAEKEQTREERESDRETIRLERMQAATMRRREIETQREREIQDTINRRRDIKAQNQTARSLNHLQRICDNREQEAVQEAQKRHKEIQRREHFRKVEADNQKRKDLRLAMHENKMMDMRSQVLP